LNSLPAVARWLTRWRWIRAVDGVVADRSVAAGRHTLVTSPPAQKPLPAPVSTTHFTLRSNSALASWAASAAVIAPDMACVRRAGSGQRKHALVQRREQVIRSGVDLLAAMDVVSLVWS